MQRYLAGSTATRVRGVALVGLSAVLALGACGGAGAPAPATAAPTTAAPTVAATTAATRALATSPAAATVTVKGTITKVADSGKTITVKTTDGKEIVFEISSSRTTLKDERPGSPVKARGDLKVGLLVTVEGPAAGGEAKTFTVTG